MRAITVFNTGNPTPNRNWDFRANFEDDLEDGVGTVMGEGSTVDEAIAELITNAEYEGDYTARVVG